MRKKKDICLAMLVRDEESCIQRCLASLKPYVCSYCIVDTGSTDSTADLVRETLGDMPGNLKAQPFSSFSLLREQLYQQAGQQAEHILFVDADETLEFDDGHAFEKSLPDIGLIEISYGSYSTRQPRLLRKSLGLQCVGHVAEQLVPPTAVVNESMFGLRLINHQDGYRSRQANTRSTDVTHLLAELGSGQRDAEILLQLGKLTSSFDSARQFFHDCLGLATNKQTQWQAYYHLGKLIEQQGEDPDIVINTFMQAYELFPERAEPLRRIIEILRCSGRDDDAQSLCDIADSIELPQHADYFEPMIYRGPKVTHDR